MMAVILPYNRLRTQFPKSSIMIRASSDEVCTIGTKGTIPNPSLMSCEARFQGKGTGLTFDGEVLVPLDVMRSVGVDRPDASIVVG